MAKYTQIFTTCLQSQLYAQLVVVISCEWSTTLIPLTYWGPSLVLDVFSTCQHTTHQQVVRIVVVPNLFKYLLGLLDRVLHCSQVVHKCVSCKADPSLKPSKPWLEALLFFIARVYIIHDIAHKNCSKW
jgi:hypothetical protein